MNPETGIKKEPDLKAVIESTIYKPKSETVTVIGVNIETVTKCGFCKIHWKCHLHTTVT